MMSQKLPLVSVVIPIFNRPKQLKKALESVLTQTYKNYEIIVVDDGSTPKLSLSFHKNKKIKVLHHDKNRGAAAARNTGMKAAKGTYIAFLDSDDEWYPEKLRIQVNTLEGATRNITGCVTSVFLKGSRSECTRYTPLYNFREQTLAGHHLSIGSTLLFRKDSLKIVGFQPEDLKRLEDWEWQIKVSDHYVWISLPKVLVQVNRGTPPSFESAQESIEIIKKRVKLHSEKEKKIFQNRCLYELFLAALLNKKFGKTLLFLGQLMVTDPEIIVKKIVQKLFSINPQISDHRHPPAV